MPCKALPPSFWPTPTSLPAGVGIPTFTPPSVSVGLCCNFQIPVWGSFPLPLPPFPPGALTAVIALVASIDDAVSLVFDSVAIPCPSQ